MRPLQCVPFTVNISNAPQSILDVLIPANTWAQYKRLVVIANFQVVRHAPIPPGATQYFEGYNMSGIGNVQRGGLSAIAATSLFTQYQIDRHFILDTVTHPHETNFDTLGIASLANVQGANHFLSIVPGIAAFDQTVDNVLSFTIYNNDPTTADTCQVGSAQAYVQAPLNLNRLPQ